MKHLKENKIGYWEHWRRAMLCSAALFVHAWFPFILEDYASNKLKENKGYGTNTNTTKNKQKE